MHPRTPVIEMEPQGFGPYISEAHQAAVAAQTEDERRVRLIEREEMLAAVVVEMLSRAAEGTGGYGPLAQRGPASHKTPAPLVVFCHGMDGRPDGPKPAALRAAGLEVLSPDHVNLYLSERIKRLRELLLKLGRKEPRRPIVLVGSSLGGITALATAIHLSNDHAPLCLKGLVLCAPAIGPRNQAKTGCQGWAPPVPTLILHGVRDPSVVFSRAYVAAHPTACLLEVDDDHPLRRSSDLIVEATKLMLELQPVARSRLTSCGPSLQGSFNNLSFAVREDSWVEVFTPPTSEGLLPSA